MPVNTEPMLWAAVAAVFFTVLTLCVAILVLFINRADTDEKTTQSVLEQRTDWYKIILYGIAGVVFWVGFATYLNMPGAGFAILLVLTGLGYFQQKKSQNEVVFAFDEELPTLLTRWANDMASGRSFDRAVEMSFPDASPSVRPVLSAILPQISENPIAAFQAAQIRMERQGVDSEAFRMVVAVVSAGSQAGKLGPALTKLASTLQEIENLKLMVRKETESGRRNVNIMVAGGALIAVLFNLAKPPMLGDIPTTPQSQLLFAAAIALLAGAWVGGYYVSRTKV